MARKRFVRLLLSSFVALGVALFCHANNDDVVVRADGTELVGTPEVGWNNVDYSKEANWVTNRDQNGIPLEGYCLLPIYPSNITSQFYTDENLLTANIPGCNVGDYILINGVASKNVEGVVIYGYPLDGFFIYVPHSSITFSDEYAHLTINVLEGMSIDGTAQTVATRFEYRGLLGSHGNWQVNPEPEVRIKGEFSKIDWNNVDYSYTLNQQWTGELMPNGAPMFGYCLLAFFNEEGKTYSESVIGDVMMTGRGVIGIGLNADYKIKVNGVNIIDVEDSICYIFPAYGLFFYIPNSSITYSEQYPIPVISLEEGLHFNNVYLPQMDFEFKGEIGEPNCWTYRKDPSEYNRYDFKGVANGWNNIPADSTHNQNVLQFGEYGEYLKNDQQSDSTNLVNRYSDCGTKITINGTPLYELEEAVVNYLHGYCYVYIVLPISALTPSNGYKVVTLHIEQDTIFYDTLLPEVNLYLFNGKWIYDRPETPEDGDYDNALSLEATFGHDEVVLDENNKQVSATKQCSINSFALFANYKLITEDSAFVLCAAGSRNQGGLRLVFSGNTISLYDATQGNVLLGNTEIEGFTYDEWCSLLLYTKVVDNKLSILVAVDDITYIHADNVVFADQSGIGNLFSLSLGDGAASLKNAVYGADIKKPSLTYTGKSVYGVLAGSDVIDFTNKCSAFDAHDGDVTSLIRFNWPEGALSGETINKGTWKVEIVASDRSSNKTQIVVTVIATDKLDVTVTFDGANPVNYRVGDHIACVPDPVKEGNDATRYRFIGWYYNGRLWDFENDYVITDMNLVSKFQETAEEHCVTFNVEGLSGVSSYSLYFAHGAKLSIDAFNKDGYTLKAFVNDEEVTSITVNENMTVKLVYTSTNTEPTKKGCSGEVISSVIFIPLILGAAIILLVVLRKKGGKEHE